MHTGGAGGASIGKSQDTRNFGVAGLGGVATGRTGIGTSHHKKGTQQGKQQKMVANTREHPINIHS